MVACISCQVFWEPCLLGIDDETADLMLERLRAL
jgi:hypothetical protein